MQPWKISKPSPHTPSCVNLTNNLESKKPNTKAYILHVTICTEFKPQQNKSPGGCSCECVFLDLEAGYMGQCVKLWAIHFRSAHFLCVCYTLKRHICIKPVHLRAILLFFFPTDWWTKWLESHREREGSGGSGTQGSKQMPQRGPSQSILRKSWGHLWGLGQWGFQIKRKAARGPENGFTILNYDTLLSSLLENTPAVERFWFPTRKGTHIDGHEPWKPFLVATILPVFRACLSLFSLVLVRR